MSRIIRRLLLSSCLLPFVMGSKASGQARFTVEQKGTAHRFVDANGDGIWILGVNHIGNTSSNHRTHESLEVHQARVQAAKHLQGWGYNSAGGDNSGPIQNELPYFVTVSLSNTAHWMPQHRFEYEDVFSDRYRLRIEAAVEKTCAQHRGKPLLVGYFWTDTPRWDLGLSRSRRGMDWVSYVRSLPASTPGKQAYVSFLRSYFSESVERLNQAFRSQFDSFDQVAASKLQGLELARPEVRQSDLAFLGVVADRIYSIASKAFEQHDPDALLLGEKYKSHDHPSTVLAAAVKHVDVISIQDGPEYGPFPGQGRHESQFDQAYFDALHESTGKPILIVDHAVSWKVPGRTNTLWYQCESQGEAALMYDRYLTAAVKTPAIIGLCRCQYVSLFQPDRGLLKQGLLDERGKPYSTIVESFAESNRRALKIRRELERDEP